MTTENLLNYFYRKDVLILGGAQLAKEFVPEQLLGSRVSREVKDPHTGEVLAREGRKFNKATLRALEAAKLREIPIAMEEAVGRVSAHDVVDSTTGEVLVQCNEELTEEIIERLRPMRCRLLKCCSPRIRRVGERCG